MKREDEQGGSEHSDLEETMATPTASPDAVTSQPDGKTMSPPPPPPPPPTVVFEANQTVPMKNCPSCNRTYDGNVQFCLDDGSLLVAQSDPEATLVNSSTHPRVSPSQTPASKKSLFIGLAIAAVVIGAMVVAFVVFDWGSANPTPAAATPRPPAAAGTQPSGPGQTLTAADMALLVNEQPGLAARLSSDPEARKNFAQNLREVLSVAEEARRNGFADRPEIKRQMDLMRTVVIAQSYFKSQPGYAGEGGPVPNISDADIDELFKQPAQQEKFDQLIKDFEATNPGGTKMPDDRIKMVRQRYGQALIGETRGLQAGVDKKREVELQIMMEQSQVLRQSYSQEELQKKMKATDQEIDAYMQGHPELDSGQARAKAEEILRRARGGEDFAALAREFSTDPGSKDKGGDLDWFPKGKMTPKFEEAAFALKEGQISDLVETPFGFHIIKLEGRRIQTKDGNPVEEIHARHILISAGPAGAPGTPGKSGRDQAREAVEKEKQKQIMDDILKRSNVTVAEDFQVSAPPPVPVPVPSATPARPR